MKKLFSGKLDDTVLFAFDDIRDRDVIERKLDLLNRAVPVHKRIKFMYFADLTGQGYGSRIFGDRISGTHWSVRGF